MVNRQDGASAAVQLLSAVHTTRPAPGAYFALCILIPEDTAAIYAAWLSRMAGHGACV